MNPYKTTLATGMLWFAAAALSGAASPKEAADAAAEHSQIGIVQDHVDIHTHTLAPGAQWYPDAGFGLFIHFGLASVRAMNISWPMIPGRALAASAITAPAEQARVIRDGDWNLNGKPNGITPNEYWSMAPEFNPQNYNPDVWIKAAKAAGFTYAVLTTRHHEGFALWPSAYGDFNTKTFMGGRDLLRPYVEACRKYGLKVGFYYSPPDWHFDRDYMSFLYGGAKRTNPWVPSLDAELKVRTGTHTAEQLREHQLAFAAYERGQIEELLTRYGKIDLLWFDGRPPIPNAESVISQERIRQLQPDIVINPRLHGHGDYITYERRLPAERPDIGWAEFCNTWTSSWSHQEIPFRSDAYVLGQLALCRSWGINYLLGVGPTKTGAMADGVYENMAVVANWMSANGASVKGVTPLPPAEKASVPATAAGRIRYLFAIPAFRHGGSYPNEQLPAQDVTLRLTGAGQPVAVTLLGNRRAIPFTYEQGVLTVAVPTSMRTALVDVIRVELKS